jgi:exonuclease SbcC
MINSLTIQNFQSHKKTELVFDNGINIIIGQSDSGKSAILRALNWVINNKPSGEAFRSSWGGETEVNICLDDNQIHRIKGKENSYLMDVADFKSFGQDVPEEIKQQINFSPLNMAGQFDSPFLLAMSGGEVARYLNKIVHLDVIDKSLSNIGRVLTKEKTDLKYKEEEYKNAKEKEKEFDWLDEAEGCLVKLELFENNLRQRNMDCSRLAFQLSCIKEAYEKLDELPDLSDYEIQVTDLIYSQKKIHYKKEKIDKFNNCVENILVKEGQIRIIEKDLGSWEAQFEATMPQQCPLCGRGE